VAQGNEAWKMMRLGKITASRIADIMATGRGGKPSATRENYLTDLALERLTGSLTPEGYTSAAMEHGKELEAIARAEYELRTGADVDEVDFIDHPDLPNAGASPDGLVDPDGLVEFKCPLPKTHLATLRSREIDRPYMLQMHWQMACARRRWCDFVSYCPQFPDSLAMVVIRVEWNDELGRAITDAVIAANDEIENLVRELRTMEG
jgi:putative phage-type endonuclease